MNSSTGYAKFGRDFSERFPFRSHGLHFAVIQLLRSATRGFVAAFGALHLTAPLAFVCSFHVALISRLFDSIKPLLNIFRAIVVVDLDNYVLTPADMANHVVFAAHVVLAKIRVLVHFFGRKGNATEPVHQDLARSTALIANNPMGRNLKINIFTVAINDPCFHFHNHLWTQNNA